MVMGLEVTREPRVPTAPPPTVSVSVRVCLQYIFYMHTSTIFIEQLISQLTWGKLFLRTYQLTNQLISFLPKGFLYTH